MIIKIFFLIGLILTVGFLFRSLRRFWQLRNLDQIYVDTMSFPNERSLYFEKDGVKIHYILEGRGPMIFLVHGIGANIYCWRYLVAKLARNFTVCAVDLPGFGQSGKPKKGYTVQLQAQRLLALLAHLKIKSSYLVGSSMGGAIVCEMVIQQPELFPKIILLPFGSLLKNLFDSYLSMG